MSHKSGKAAELIIKAIEMRYEATFQDASVRQWIRELEHLSEAELNTAFQRFKLEYESLPFRFAVSAGLLKQLKPTFTTATVEERLFASLDDKDPSAFLNSVNPKLCQLAYQGGIFDRQLTGTEQNFRIKDVAKRFLEWQQNDVKGFKQPEPETAIKALSFDCEQVTRVQNPLKGLSIPEAAERAKELLEQINKKGGASNAN